MMITIYHVVAEALYPHSIDMILVIVLFSVYIFLESIAIHRNKVETAQMGLSVIDYLRKFVWLGETIITSSYIFNVRLATQQQY